MNKRIWDELSGAKIYDLSHELREGIPASPSQVGFRLALNRRHSDDVLPSGLATASEVIFGSTHAGTHVDALCHVSQDGRLHGGIEVKDVEGARGFTALSIDTLPPFLGRGVMLDIARLHGVEVVDARHEVTARELQEAEEQAGAVVGPGDAVLIRTGWSAHWSDPVRFLGHRDGAPGPGTSAARWLGERGVALVGGETVALEIISPGSGLRELPVHGILLVEHGIPIIEMMDLGELAASGIAEFLFCLAPLRIGGGTGAPVRPLAVAVRSKDGDTRPAVQSESVLPSVGAEK